MPIVITSKKDGFRRCGLAHPARPTEHPDDRFTEAQLHALKTEPMLVVETKPAPEPKADKKTKKE